MRKSAASLPACSVCSSAGAKYKCPRCRASYCGVACNKTHAETPCAPPPAAEELAAPLPPRDFEAPEVEEQAGLRVPQADLQRLAADSRVLDALRSAELRRLVRLVDSAPDGEAALEAAMANPRFAAFADRVLAALRGDSA